MNKVYVLNEKRDTQDGYDIDCIGVFTDQNKAFNKMLDEYILIIKEFKKENDNTINANINPSGHMAEVDNEEDYYSWFISENVVDGLNEQDKQTEQKDKNDNHEIIVVIDGGVMQDCYSDIKIGVTLLDYDNMRNSTEEEQKDFDKAIEDIKERYGNGKLQHVY